MRLAVGIPDRHDGDGRVVHDDDDCEAPALFRAAQQDMSDVAVTPVWILPAEPEWMPRGWREATVRARRAESTLMDQGRSDGFEDLRHCDATSANCLVSMMMKQDPGGSGHRYIPGRSSSL